MVFRFGFLIKIAFVFGIGLGPGVDFGFFSGFSHISGLARASVLVEPYAGLSKLETHTEFGGFTTKDIANGIHLGGRLGFFFGKKFFVHAEYFHGGPYKFNSGGIEAEFSQDLIGGGVGMHFDSIRVSASYFPSADSDETISNVTKKGYSARAGFGIVVNKKIHANFDVFFHQIKKSVSGTFETELSGESLQTAAISISVPIDF